MHTSAVILIGLTIFLMVAFACVRNSGRAVKRWQALVERELKRRNLVRVPSSIGMDVDPADGYQLIDMCTCERNGKLHNIILLVRRRSRSLARFVVEEVPAD